MKKVSKEVQADTTASHTPCQLPHSLLFSGTCYPLMLSNIKSIYCIGYRMFLLFFPYSLFPQLVSHSRPSSSNARLFNIILTDAGPYILVSKANTRNSLNNMGRKSIDCPFSLMPEPRTPCDQTVSNLKQQLHSSHKLPLYTAPTPAPLALSWPQLSFPSATKLFPKLPLLETCSLEAV